MKRLIVLIVLMMSIGCCGHLKNEMVMARVLSINENIWVGDFKAGFLSGTSGILSSDNIKIGVELVVQGEELLVDLNFNHAQLSYFLSQEDPDYIKLTYSDRDCQFYTFEYKNIVVCTYDFVNNKQR